eukprot:2328217-Alexandrium_andersonii.AAC.1
MAARTNRLFPSASGSRPRSPHEPDQEPGVGLEGLDGHDPSPSGSPAPAMGRAADPPSGAS